MRHDNKLVDKHKLWNRTVSDSILVSHETACEVLGKSLSVSESQRSVLQNRARDACLTGVL